MTIVYEDTVRPEWIDYNGHMSEAFYVLVFGYATDTFLDTIGLDSEYRTAHKVSAFTVEAHVRYLDQAIEGDPLHVSTLLAGLDAKRAHLFHTMASGPGGRILATEEVLMLHVDTSSDRVCPFDEPTQKALDSLLEQHGNLGAPKDLGRSINIPKL